MKIVGCLWEAEYPRIRGANFLRSGSPWGSNFYGMELLCVTILTPAILRWLLWSWKIVATLP